MSGSVSLIDGHIDEVFICPVCGKEFTPSFNRQQKYCCAECRKIAKKRKDREYYREYYREGRWLKKKKKEPVAPHVQVKSRSLSSLSGEELLHYGQIQQGMNMDALRVHIPKE
jgi:hypothetical protein